jgi:hypothetical protein
MLYRYVLVGVTSTISITSLLDRSIRRMRQGLGRGRGRGRRPPACVAGRVHWLPKLGDTLLPPTRTEDVQLLQFHPRQSFKPPDRSMVAIELPREGLLSFFFPLVETVPISCEAG